MPQHLAMEPTFMHKQSYLDILIFRGVALKALSNQQAKLWRKKVRPSLCIAIMLGLLSQVYLIADVFSTLPDGTMARAFAAPFDDWNMWLLYAGGLFGAIAVWYGYIASKTMQSLQSPNNRLDRSRAR
jgi:hypothetical protein